MAATITVGQGTPWEGGPAAGLIRLDDRDPNISSTNCGLANQGSVNYQGTITYTNVGANTIQFNFTGTSLRVYARNITGGTNTVALVLDGNSTPLPICEVTNGNLIYQAVGLIDREHSAQITLNTTNGWYFQFDCVDIDTGRVLRPYRAISASLNPPNPTNADAWFTGLASNYPWTNVTSATVNWNFKDPDAGDAQSAYQVVASNDGWATWTKNTGKILDVNARASTISGLTPGTWHFAVYIWDRGDAISPAFGDLHLQIDQTAPTATSTTGTQYVNIPTNGTFRVWVYGVTDASPGSGVQVVKFPTGLNATNWVWFDGVKNGATNDWYCDIPISSVSAGGPEGRYQTDPYVYDVAGNNRYAGTSPQTYVDRTAPTIGGIDATMYDNVNTGTHRTTVTNVADTGSSGLNRVDFWYRKSTDRGATWGAWSSNNAGVASGTSYYYDVPRSGDGYYQVDARAYDNTGNVSNSNNPITTYFWVDTVIPVITSVSAQQYIINSNSATVWAYGVTDSNGIDHVSVYAVRPDGSYYLLGNATKNGTTNDYSYNVTDITINGNWRYDFRAYDPTGNVCNYGTTGYAPAYVSRTNLATDPAYKTEGGNAIVTGTIGTGIGNAITAYGHCWATTTNPTTSNSFVNLGPITVTAATTTSIGSTIGPLTLGTTYYVRTYVTYAGGTLYGSQITVISGTVRGRLKKGDLLLTGQVDEITPPVNNGLVCHFPLNGSGKRAAGTVGLVSYFPFKDDVADRMKANTLTVIGPTPDPFGGGYVWKVETDRIYLNTPVSSTTLTVEMYYTYGGKIPAQVSNYNTLLCRDGGTYHHLLINPNNEIGFYNAAFYSSGYKMVPGREYHLQLIKNGTKHWLYIDGQLVQYDTSSFDNATYPLVSIGNYDAKMTVVTAPPIQGATGKIRELKIYNAVVPGGAGFGCNKSNLLGPDKIFNGTSDFVNAGPIDLDYSKGFHFKFRARWDALGSWSRILDFGNGTPNNTLIIANSGTSNTFQFNIYNGTVQTDGISVAAITIGELAEWIVSMDSSKVAKIYKNGILVVSAQFSALPVNISRTNGYIGKSEWPDAFFQGYISYVHFYDRPYDEVNNMVYEETDIYLSQPTTNLWTGGFNMYNNYASDITTTLTQTPETLFGMPIWKATYKPTTATGLNTINTELGSHGVYGSRRTYDASTYYTASIYWRCLKPSVTLNGAASNIAGWSTPITVDVGNGWKRSTIVWYDTVARTDDKYWGFKDTAATLNDIISIDWACPQIEQRDFATAYSPSARTGMGKFWMPTDGLPMTNAFTYSLWFNLPHMHTASGVDSIGIQSNWFHPIIELTPMTNRADVGLSLCAGPAPASWNRKIVLRYPGNITGTIAIQDNTWYHGAITYDGANYQVYINGVNDITYASTVAPTTFADTVLMVGGGYYGAAHAKVKGLSIYNRALSSAEITKLYKNRFSLLKTGDIRTNVVNERLQKPDWIHFGLFNSGVSIDKQWTASTETNPIYTQDGTYIGVGATNLFTGTAPWSNNGATVTDVTATLPGPIKNSSTWKLVKDGTANQWNGWEGNYNSMSLNAGDYFTSSGWYRTNSLVAGITNWDISFHTTDWVRALNTTTIYDNTKIIADGQWHQYSKTVLVNETISAFILDTNWGYSTQPGVLYVNGVTWTKTAYPVPSLANSASFTHPYVSLPANVIDVSKNFTIMGWFTPGQIATARYEAVLTRDNGSNDRILIMTEYTNDSTLNCWYGNPTTGVAMQVPGSVVEAFKPQFFALMRNGTNISLYFGKDGVITSVSRTDATLLDTQTQTTVWRLGQWGDTDTINGYMKDLSFIRYALTDQQIKDYYHTQMRSANSDGSLCIQGQVVERQVL